VKSAGSSILGDEEGSNSETVAVGGRNLQGGEIQEDHLSS